MIKKTLTISLSILGISFLVYFNLALYNFTEPLYYCILVCSLIGSYHLLKGLVSNPR